MEGLLQQDGGTGSLLPLSWFYPHRPPPPLFLSYRSSRADLCPRSLLAWPVGEVGRTGARVGEGPLQLIKSSSFVAQSHCCSSLLPFIFRGGVGKRGGLSESLLFIYIYVFKFLYFWSLLFLPLVLSKIKNDAFVFRVEGRNGSI